MIGGNLRKMANEHSDHSVEHTKEPSDRLEGMYRICLIGENDILLGVTAMESENLTIGGAIEKVLSRNYEFPLKRAAENLRMFVRLSQYHVYVDTSGYWDDNASKAEFMSVLPDQPANEYILDMDGCRLRTLTFSLSDVKR